MLNSGSVAIVKRLLKNLNNISYKAECQVYAEISSLKSYPFDCRSIGIFNVYNKSVTEVVELNFLSTKCMLLPYEDKKFLFCIPLLHEIKVN